MKHTSREKSKTFRKETFSERRAFLLFRRNAVKRDDDHRRLHSFLHIQNHSSCFFVTVLKNFNPLSEEIKLRGCREHKDSTQKSNVRLNTSIPSIRKEYYILPDFITVCCTMSLLEEVLYIVSCLDYSHLYLCDLYQGLAYKPLQRSYCSTFSHMLIPLYFSKDCKSYLLWILYSNFH